MGAKAKGRFSGERSKSPMAAFSLSLERFAYDYHSTSSSPRRILLHSFGDGSRAGIRRGILQAATPPAAPPALLPATVPTLPPPPPRSSASAFQTLDPTVVIILVVLLFALICAAFLNSIMRCLLRRSRGRRAQAAAAAAAGGRASQSSAPGLDPKSLASLPVLTFNGTDKSLCKEASADCAICLSEFVQSEKLRLLPKCSHVFHLDCIDMWLQSHVSCPVCRDDIEDEDLVPVPPDSEDQHSPARGALIPMILIRDRNGQASASAAPPGGETPDLHAELLRDSAGRSVSSGGASVSSQQQQGESSSRRSLRSTLSSMFAADHFFSARWQASSSSSSGAVAAVTPATARSQSARASG